MNIVVSLNANYLRPLCVMLRSLLDANPGEEADVYVLHASLSPEAFSFARSVLPDGRLRLFDVRVPEDFMADAPVLFHFPKEMYYRIFSARLLPQTLGRALYLDPDMVINRPLAPLYGMELGEHFFAAARSVNPRLPGGVQAAPRHARGKRILQFRRAAHEPGRAARRTGLR